MRELVQYVYGGGDLRGAMSSSSRALNGAGAHRTAQKKQGENYRSEVSVAYFVDEPQLNLKLMIHGRIDGVISSGGSIVIEEIKSTAGDLEDLAFDKNSLHFAQAKTYAFMYADRENLDKLNVRLTYVQLQTEKTRSFDVDFDYPALSDFFEHTIDAYLERARELSHWRETRNRSIHQLSFPFDSYRKGQKSFSDEVYQAIAEECKLFAQAPTGLGKTLAVLYPSIKALGDDLCSKIFYFTARTTAREAAEKAVDQLRAKSLRLKSITLTAKEKICFKDEMSCSPETCDYLVGYYDRVKGALRDIFANDAFTRGMIETFALKHRLCPFEFSLDLSLISDCIICDYNYLFDPRVQLYRYFSGDSQSFVFLVDEAHNMVERSRDMYSTILEKREFLKVKRLVDKKERANLYQTIDALDKYLLGIRKTCEKEQAPLTVEKECPVELMEYLEDFVIAAESALDSKEPMPFEDQLQELCFKAAFFVKISKIARDKDAFVTLTSQKGSDVAIKLLCLDAADQLRETAEKGVATVYFSATLSPMDYFFQLLGGNPDDKRIILPSPFPNEHFSLNLVSDISTRYRDRDRSYRPIAEYLKVFVNQRKGNYLICFPSYAYMENVLEEFARIASDIPTIAQQRNMSEADRDAFLAKFTADRESALAGFVVMGGIFAESVDLPGERLTGAAIIGVGLPQIGKERDLILQYFNFVSGAGFQFAYTYPGMNRVLQAAGRVIRTETDRGSLLLIDDRFGNAGYQRLFPPEWAGMKRVRNQRHLAQILTEFWN